MPRRCTSVRLTITATAIDRLMATSPPHASNWGNALARYSLNPSDDAASGAENPTKNDTQPVRNPKIG